MKKPLLKRKGFYTTVTLCLVCCVLLGLILDYFNLLPKPYYNADDFGIEVVKSQSDFDGDGIDDYTDILLGARRDAENHPTYDGKYIDGGYPPDYIGVCSDVVWRAFKNAGYSLKDMVDADIANNVKDYPRVSKPDPNIDFRRVKNLRVFFDKYAVKLTTDTEKTAEWQPGDIVIFNNNKHIGIVSDKRNSDGRVYIIHNGGQPNRDEDYFKRTNATVVAHYRFDVTKIDTKVLKPWKE